MKPSDGDCPPLRPRLPTGRDDSLSTRTASIEPAPRTAPSSSARCTGRETLVLVPAGPGDSETTWRCMLPRLRERFTCHALDTRGRGLSGGHPEHAPDRLVADITASVESVGDPVGVVSAGNVEWPMVTANGSSAVAAVAAWVPVLRQAASEVPADVFGRVGALAACPLPNLFLPRRSQARTSSAAPAGAHLGPGHGPTRPNSHNKTWGNASTTEHPGPINAGPPHR
jgi:pimeloyl-ACP methyl ester carboxylesterase